MDKKPTKGEYLEVLLRSPKTVFSIKDVVLLWAEERERRVAARLNKYAKVGKLVRLRRGFYAKDKNYDRLELATRIYTPSYISFETVLTREGINFQYYKTIFVASYITREIEVDKQNISYIRMKDYVLSNTTGVEQKGNVAIATKERAFLDRIYISKDYHFDNLDALDWGKVFEILPIYNNKRMKKKTREYYKNINNGELIKKQLSDKIKEDMFAHKLMAMLERVGKTSRDIYPVRKFDIAKNDGLRELSNGVYDVWYFLKNDWPINKEIVERRSGVSFKEALQKCVQEMEKIKDRNLLVGLGESLSDSQKDWARAKLKSETIFLLKARLESLSH